MSPRLPAVSSRKLIAALARAGFYIHNVQGSHYALRHRIKAHLRVTVPFHNKDIRPSTIKAILGQAELSLDDLLEVL
jgi:predicted RNA binding protein YcfA (HicA-like mRNA interferase family)